MARKKHQYFWVIETFSTDSTLRITGWQWSAAELPVRIDAVVMPNYFYIIHAKINPPMTVTITPKITIPQGFLYQDSLSFVAKCKFLLR